MPQDKTSQKRFQRIEQLIQQIDSVADPQVRAGAVELVQSLLEMHGGAINRLLEIVSEDPAGQAIIDQLGEDELVGGLLLLYGLHPVDFQTRVMQALDKVRPYLKSHGGNVELLGVDQGVVQLQMVGSCHGCPSSAMTLKLAIEEAIYEAAPDVTELRVAGVVEQPPAAPALVPLQRLRADVPTGEQNGSWKEVSGVAALSQGSVQAIAVEGRPVLFCRWNGDLYAYAGNCSSCGHALDAARLDATTLICPHCAQGYDISRAGLGLNQSGLQLQPFPLLMEGGQARIALPGLAVS